MPELENSQFITMEVLKEMLAMQNDSYQMSVEMLVEDIQGWIGYVRTHVPMFVHKLGLIKPRQT